MIPVTVYTSTRNRYNTTLPLLLSSILLQTQLPEELIIYDDGDKLDMRAMPHIFNLLKAFEAQGVFWHVEMGEGRGQVLNHKRALIEAKYDLIFRVDDDDILEHNVLETLYNNIGEYGAIGCPIVPPIPRKRPSFVSSKIEDVYLGCSEQWFLGGEDKEVDHLFSSFLYDRRKAPKYHDLSPLAHREETLFTMQMKCFFTSKCTMWHMHPGEGGGRDNQRDDYARADTVIFNKFCEDRNIVFTKEKLICLDSGIGDHFAFLQVLPEIKEKYPTHKLIIGCCYPEVFEDQNVILTSIGDFEYVFGSREKYNIYAFMDRFRPGNLVDAFRRMYVHSN